MTVRASVNRVRAGRCGAGRGGRSKLSWVCASGATLDAVARRVRRTHARVSVGVTLTRHAGDRADISARAGRAATRGRSRTSKRKKRARSNSVRSTVKFRSTAQTIRSTVRFLDYLDSTVYV